MFELVQFSDERFLTGILRLGQRGVYGFPSGYSIHYAFLFRLDQGEFSVDLGAPIIMLSRDSLGGWMGQHVGHENISEDQRGCM